METKNMLCCASKRRCDRLWLGFVAVALATALSEARHVSRTSLPDSQLACPDVYVGLTVSSLTDSAPARQLELVWAHATPRAGDFVALYDQVAMTTPLATATVSSANGHAATGVAAPVTDPAALTFEKQCLGFYVAYVRDGDQVLASGCLETNPRWMSNMRSELGQLTLTTAFLPGVHDTAAFKPYDGTVDNLVEKYTYTQEEDVLGLLVLGARYLDMRVAYRPDQPDVWWTNHGAVMLRPLQGTLDQVKRFLDNTDEIVIFDIHGLSGFDSAEVHAAFAAHLAAELGDRLALSALTWRASWASVWASGRRLIVTYPNATVAAAHAELWQNVRHMWANTNTLDGLRQYGQQVFDSPAPTIGWSFMAELTATPTDVALDRLDGLRKMADDVNQDVSEWFSLDWGKKANIVATDFFRGNTIVHEAIQWNLYRSTGSPCLSTWLAKKPDEARADEA